MRVDDRERRRACGTRDRAAAARLRPRARRHRHATGTARPGRSRRRIAGAAVDGARQRVARTPAAVDQHGCRRPPLARARLSGDELAARARRDVDAAAAIAARVGQDARCRGKPAVDRSACAAGSRRRRTPRGTSARPAGRARIDGAVAARVDRVDRARRRGDDRVARLVAMAQSARRAATAVRERMVALRPAGRRRTRRESRCVARPASRARRSGGTCRAGG
ncbi:conserved hypothetical protein, partial [Ricinus communis]